MKPKNLKEVLSMPAIEAAPLLLGWTLVRQTPKGVVKLKIVETEAYHQDDEASHSFKWRTARTAPMFETGGRLYVYFTYGMHYCINIVVGSAGVGEAVLLRAAEPLSGIEIMKKNRGIADIKNLANGPAKLAQALGIRNTALSGTILNKSSIYLQQPEMIVSPDDIVAGPRIGIKNAVDKPWRFYIKDNPSVSKL